MHYYKREWPLAGSRGQGEGLSTLSIMDGSVSGAADESWVWIMNITYEKDVQAIWECKLQLVLAFGDLHKLDLTPLNLNYKDDLYFNSLWLELRGMQHKDKVGKCRNADNGLTKCRCWTYFIPGITALSYGSQGLLVFFLVACLISWKNFRNPRVPRQ